MEPAFVDFTGLGIRQIGGLPVTAADDVRGKVRRVGRSAAWVAPLPPPTPGRFLLVPWVAARAAPHRWDLAAPDPWGRSPKRLIRAGHPVRRLGELVAWAGGIVPVVLDGDAIGEKAVRTVFSILGVPVEESEAAIDDWPESQPIVLGKTLMMREAGRTWQVTFAGALLGVYGQTEEEEGAWHGRGDFVPQR